MIAERGFAPGTAVRVAALDPAGGEYAIEYDLPITDGREWKGQSEGLTVLVDKAAAEDLALSGMVVDFADGSFTFHRN